MWVNGTEPGRPFAATFTLQGDRLVGQVPLHELAGADRDDPHALRRPPQGAVGWTMTVRRTAR